MSVFKAYDIRGIYGREIDENFAYSLGYFLPELLDVRRILIGYDTRNSSESLLESFKKGCIDSGCDIYDMGLCTTPMLYFGTCKKNFPASVMITASHNDKEYNGFKISKSKAVPIGLDTGLLELDQMMRDNEIIVSRRKGISYKMDIENEYIHFLKGNLKGENTLSLAIDCSNGMTSMFVKKVFGEQHNYLFDTLDGNFPNHSPNPLMVENCKALSDVIKKEKNDFGIVFDGDGDRAVFLDEKGTVIPSDLMITLLASELASQGSTVLYDIRTSKSVTEYLDKNSIKPYMWKVGHYFAKNKMRELDAVVGGELAGHYYFKNFFYCDSAIYAAIVIYNAVAKLKKEGKTISDFVKSVKKYENSGEINFTVKDKEKAIQFVVDFFEKEDKLLRTYDFDGIRCEFRDYWFNIRPSNTEPYLRVVVEAKNKKILNEKLEKIRNILNA